MSRRIKVGIPQKVIGLVIGKQHSNLQRIKEETGASSIKVINNEIYVSGGHQECKKAIVQLKTSAFEGMYYNLKKQFSCDTYDFVDGTGQVCQFKLKQVDCPAEYWYQNREYFKVEKVYEEGEIASGGEIEISDLKTIITKVLQKMQNSKDDQGKLAKADFWSHFGHIFITSVDEDDENAIHSLDELKKQFNKKSGWKMMFNSATKNMEMANLEEALHGNEYTKIPPHIRYDLSFLTPSCNRIRVKFFLDLEGKPNLEFCNEFIDTKEDSLSSDYLLCNHFYHRAKVSIAIPSHPFDVRMTIRTVASSLDKSGFDPDVEKENEKTLRTYLDMVDFEEEEIILPDDKHMPHDFCLQYVRKCSRRFYSYDKGEDTFTIAVSEEKEMDCSNATEVKTDIHVYSDQCNSLLRSGDWVPEQIVSKLSIFLEVLREIQENVSVEEG